MSNESLENLVNEALQIHFKRMTQYKIELLAIENFNNNPDKPQKNIDFTFGNRDNVTVTFNENGKIYETEVLGIFTNKYKTFTWSWSLPSKFYGPSNLSKKLFDFYYDKDITTEYDVHDFFLRNIFITSRIQIKDSEELEVILALSEYVLKETNDFKFIFPIKKMLSKDPNDFMIIYYFAKYKLNV